MGDLLVSFVILHAEDLPKTDTFSKIDPFVKGSTSSGKAFETKKLEDTDKPRWNQEFVLRLPSGEVGVSALDGWLELALYDEDTFKDQKVGTCKLNFADYKSLSDLKYLELKIDLRDKFKKQGKEPILAVGVTGAMRTYASLRQRFSGTPGALFNDSDHRLYLPHASGRFFVGVEYEKDGVDFKLYTTSPATDIFLDLFNAGKKKSKVRRRMYKHGREIVPGLIAFQEIKLDDVDIDCDFNKVMAMHFDAQLVAEHDVGNVARHHGWRGALNFEAAASSLQNVVIDHDEHEVGMFVDAGSVVVVDWDDDNVDMKLAVIPTEHTQHMGFDLTIKDSDIKKTSTMYTPPIHKFRQYPVGRIFELDDVPHGTKLGDMAILMYQLSNMQQVSMQEMTGIMVH